MLSISTGLKFLCKANGLFIVRMLICNCMISFSVNPFPNDNFKTLPNRNSLQTKISSLMKMSESSTNWWKTLWEKEKLLVTSNFSCSHSVFKRLKLQTRKNQGLFGKGISARREINFETSLTLSK